MNEDIERIENKVDLIFKILLDLKVRRIGHIYNRKYINKYIDEIVPLYDLFAVKEVIDEVPTKEVIERWKIGFGHELQILQRNYDSGNFLSKEEEMIKARIKDLKSKMEDVKLIVDNDKKFKDKSTELYKHNLFMDLQKKLGIEEEYDGHGFRKLVREKDDLKKETKDLIDGINLFLDSEKAKIKEKGEDEST